MALQDIITNLGTAIINLVDRKILKHCEQIETVLLELKAKIDILVEESGSSSGGDTPVAPPDEPIKPTPIIEEFNIDGFTGTLTTSTEDNMYVTTYSFNPVITATKWFSGYLNELPNKFIYITENDISYELSSWDNYAEPLYGYHYYVDNKFFTVYGVYTIKQIKLYSSTIQKMNLTSLSLENLGRPAPL